MTQEKILWLDFETQSKTDLPAEGLGKYLADPTTKAYCFTWRLTGMNATELWEFGQPIPAAIIRHIEAGGLFVAHNAPFDFHIWNEVLCYQFQGRSQSLPKLKIEQVRCSAARARYNGLPGSLEGACHAMGLPIQ